MDLLAECAGEAITDWSVVERMDSDVDMASVGANTLHPAPSPLDSPDFQVVSVAH